VGQRILDRKAGFAENQISIDAHNVEQKDATMTAKSIQKPLSFADPKLQAVVDDFVAGVKLSLHRALSQHGAGADAARSAMPKASDSLEQVFSRYLSLPRVAKSLRAAAQTSSLPPVPAGVKMTDSTPVLDQMLRQRQSNRFGFSAGDARELIHNRRIIDDGGPGGDFDFGGEDGGGVDTPARKLIQLRIHKVKCLKETSGEWGDDEIAMGGYMIDDEGQVINVREFYVSKNFNTGETKAYNPPKPFGSFVAKKNGQKKIVLATIALAEKDQGGFASFLNDLWSKVTLQATVFAGALYAALNALVPGMVWVFLPGVLSGLLIGILVAAALTAIFALLASWLKDDIFKPVSTAFYVPTINAPLTTPPAVASFNGHGGRYEVTYDWAVVS
jgi:hypothetical protein